MAFEDKDGVRWLEITRDGGITVLSGYAWDGCTPKICLFDLLFGTPDGTVDSRTGRPKTYFASLVHDVLYQSRRSGLPLPRATADRFFLRLLALTGFTPRAVYYAAVRLFGGFFRKTGKYKGTEEGRLVALGASLAKGGRIVVGESGVVATRLPWTAGSV